jgi:hypothetical protein
MMTIQDAWRWYETTKRQLKLLSRIGEKYWNDLDWNGPLGRDDKLKSLESGVLVEELGFCVEHLDDFAILVLFSAFESAVREQVLYLIVNERNRLTRPLVVQLLDEARQESKRGRILRLLGYFKNQDAGLVEEVNQVRRYRNWVAHGRRTLRPAAVSPAVAYERLKRFLDRFAPPIPDEE